MLKLKMLQNKLLRKLKSSHVMKLPKQLMSFQKRFSMLCPQLQYSFYDTAIYKTVSDPKSVVSKQKYIDYREKKHLWPIFYIIYTFLFGCNMVVWLTRYLLWSPVI